MAQSDQVVQNATFPTVRADINDNLAALYSQNSGNSAPAVTVAFQPWVDTSSSPPVWKVRNGSNTAWITIGVLDPAGFNAGGVTAIANGGTGATTAALALAALLPSQGGNAGKALVTSGSAASWGVVASGASIQIFTANGTYTPTAGKTTFLVFATGGGGGGGGFTAGGVQTWGGAGAGTGLRLYTSTEMGSSATVTIAAGGTVGANGSGSGFNTVPPTAGGTGGSTSFTPSGTGLVLSGLGGGGGVTNVVGVGGGTTNSSINIVGLRTSFTYGASSFWGLGPGSGASGGSAGNAGVVLILEW
jgi:hypothetical protein